MSAFEDGVLLVDRSKAARLLSISLRLLDELTRKEEIPSIKLGRRRLYDPNRLREVVRQKFQAGDQPEEE